MSFMTRTVSFPPGRSSYDDSTVQNTVVIALTCPECDEQKLMLKDNVTKRTFVIVICPLLKM